MVIILGCSSAPRPNVDLVFMHSNWKSVITPQNTNCLWRARLLIMSRICFSRLSRVACDVHAFFCFGSFQYSYAASHLSVHGQLEKPNTIKHNLGNSNHTHVWPFHYRLDWLNYLAFLFWNSITDFYRYFSSLTRFFTPAIGHHAWKHQFQWNEKRFEWDYGKKLIFVMQITQWKNQCFAPSKRFTWCRRGNYGKITLNGSYGGTFHPWSVRI